MACQKSYRRKFLPLVGGLLALFWIPPSLSADLGKNAPLRIYGPEEIGSQEVLFSVAVDHRGRVFTVSPEHRAIFWFDGSSWHTHRLNGYPRIIVADGDGEIWMGCSRGVSRVFIDAVGSIRVEGQPADIREDDDAMFTFASPVPGGVIFYNSRLLASFTEGETKVERSPVGYEWTFADERNRLLLSDVDDKLYRMVEGRLEAVDELSELEVHQAVCVGDDSVYAWTVCGMLYKVADGRCSEFSSQLSALIDGGRIYSVVEMQHDRIGITSSAGLFVCDLHGRIVNSVNKGQGLQRDLVYGIAESGEAIWMSCGRSIACLRPARGVHCYNIADNTSKVHDIVLSPDGIIYFCTDYGVHTFRLDCSDMHVRTIEDIVTAPVYSIEVLNGEVLAASTTGLYRIIHEEDNIRAESLDAGPRYSLLDNGPGRILTSNQNGTVYEVNLEERDPASGQCAVRKGPSFPFEVRHLHRVNDELVMVRGWNGLWALMDLSQGIEDAIPILTSSNSSIIQCSAADDGNLFYFDDGLMEPFVDGNGRAALRPAAESFLNEYLTGTKPELIFPTGDDRFAVIDDGKVDMVQACDDRVKSLGTWYLGSTRNPIGYINRENTFITCVTGELINFVDLRTIQTPVDLGAPVTNGFVDAESRTESSGDVPVLKTGADIVFDFSVPACEVPAEHIRYQYRLAGLEDKWSDWSSVRHKEYTGLRGGQYVFEVRARSGEITSPVESTAFAVETPFFQTVPAYLCYLLGTIGLIIGLTTWRSRHLAQANQKMEKLVENRTRELEQKRLEVRRKSEELIVQARDSESGKLQSLSRSLGCIAHDFNNLLQVVSINCELLEQSVEPNLREVVRGISSAGEAAAGLSSRIQSFTDSMPVRKELVYLDSFITRIVQMLQSTAGDHVEIDLKTDPESPPLMIDQSRLQQAILNLTINAAESGATTITIRNGDSYLDETRLQTARRFARGAEEGVYSWIEIEDDGCGIENIEEIFDPFYSTKRLGRGLGLAIVIRAVDRCDGVVFVESSTTGDTGTTFRICFPAEKHPEAGEITADELPAALLKEDLHILVVDDEEALVDSIERYLIQQSNCNVSTALSGFEALDLLVSEIRPDIGLFDVSMPGMSGDQLVRKLRDAGHAFPVILMSGFSKCELDENVISDSSVDFIQKPFSMSAIASLLKRKTVSRPFA